MKKQITLVLIAFATTFNAFSQEVITSYNSEYFTGKSYDIVASHKEGTDIYDYYIYVASSDKLIETVLISVKNEDMPVFKSTLEKARDKYASWSATAKTNHVTELDKTMSDISYSGEAAFFYGSKWNFDFSVKLNFRAKIINNNMLLIIQNKSDLISSKNEYIDADGFNLVFSSVEEINSFLSKLDVQLAEKHFNSKMNTEELFQ